MLAAFCVVQPDALAQDVFHEGDYILTNWTRTHGFPSNTIKGIAQTPDGFVWLATLGGLVRFDGVATEVFTPRNAPELRHSVIGSVLVDRRGTLWALDRSGGLTTYGDGRFSRVAITDLNWTISGSELAEGNDGTIYVAGDRLVRCSVRECEPIAPVMPDFGTLVVDEKGQAWAGAGFGRMRSRGHRFDGHELRILLDYPGPLAFAPAPNGGVTAHGPREIVLFPDGRLVARPPDGEPWSLWEGTVDQAGNQWWVTSSGLYRVSPADWDDGVLQLGDEHRALARSFTEVFSASDGSLWLGSERGGLYLMQPRFVKRITSARANRLHQTATTQVVAQPDGSYWTVEMAERDLVDTYPAQSDVELSLLTQLVRVRHGVIVERVPQAFYQPRIAGLANGDLAILFNDPITAAPMSPHLDRGLKIARYRDGNLVPIPPARQYGLAGDIDAQKNGRMWLNPFLERGWHLIAIDSTGRETVDVPGGRFLGESSGGDAWVGLPGALGRIVDDVLETIPLDSNVELNAVFEDSADGIWVGTMGEGLWHVENRSIVKLSTENGLPDDQIGAILEDNQKRLWISSNRGIFVVRLQDLAAALVRPGTSLPHQMVTATELPTQLINRKARLAPDGRMFFATGGGIIEFDPRAVTLNTSSLGTFIGTTWTETASYGREDRLALPLGQRSVRIDYTTPDLIGRGTVTFRYRLEGIDDDWIDAGHRRDASYGPLAPGEYTFRTSARPTFGDWGAEDAMTVVIPPFYWETTWLRGLALVLIAGLVVLAHKTRSRAITARNVALEREIEARRVAEIELSELSRRMVSAQEEDRRRIARELHDDVSQRLAAASISVELARSRGREPQSELLSSLKQQLDGLSEDIRKVSHELHPETLQQLGVATALEVLCEDLGAQNKTTIRTSLSESLERIPPEVALCLYRIAQEALGNIAHHARASEAELELKVERQHARLRVADNGVGFDSSSPHKGLGLASMRERARLLGGNVTLRSAHGQGTEVVVEVPMREGTTAPVRV